MIRAVKYKFRPTSYRAELPNHQPVMINRILIQHIILLKLHRVIDKIIVHGILPHLNAGLRDNLPQINRFQIPRAGINLIH